MEAININNSNNFQEAVVVKEGNNSNNNQVRLIQLEIKISKYMQIYCKLNV
jgi:hypothetical protein